MTKYRGYYIDHIYFHNKKDIDKFCEEKALEAYKTAIAIFARRQTIEASIYASEKAEYLHNNFNYEWGKLEEIEIEVYKSVA